MPNTDSSPPASPSDTPPRLSPPTSPVHVLSTTIHHSPPTNPSISPSESSCPVPLHIVPQITTQENSLSKLAPDPEATTLPTNTTDFTNLNSFAPETPVPQDDLLQSSVPQARTTVPDNDLDVLLKQLYGQGYFNAVQDIADHALQKNHNERRSIIPEDTDDLIYHMVTTANEIEEDITGKVSEAQSKQLVDTSILPKSDRECHLA